ncbi:hypothetical protein FFK22_016955 [Mycobacterium sp. KBS0706]|uniref:hypothetical protein n=1 Tax=Mycobacterium sp. KBS0706 TaxID=2578109 RepID=UPI00110FF4D3|nr:hypothetical protein [Mycobacterium sp. KBS0706]TSD87533.1 hypothetical protein FFK22_016955 [Mycobacterium sp. KBS0706]
MPSEGDRIEGTGVLYSPRSGTSWTGRYRVASRIRRNASAHRPYGAFLTDTDVDIGYLDEFIAGADLLLQLEDGRTVKVKVGGMGYRKLGLFGARMQ